ncbi:unnamed protein product [Vitrella brassicaformis CCMP3155]|uniref:PPIase cyclophilin-type domain-containing protein n=1 Tax=Vitrella brassicaformis (strain CCMP3155) TaxID=1169540 RepID=A0A0G4F7C4_VITBC|nr:unnamed protein product [Vitrella brassicaformis CCMP3155]|eukprot:CEM08015.1 unnamed protein product [Vitrella brassicaformis CCMP3155]
MELSPQELSTGESARTQYTIHVVGKIGSADFQRIKTAAEHLSSTVERIDGCVTGLFESQFEHEVKRITKKHGDAFYPAKPQIPLVYCETRKPLRTLYFPSPPRFFSWAEKRFGYVDRTNDALYHKRATQALDRAMRDTKHIFCSFTFQIGDEPGENVVFELFTDVLPRMCDNFLKLVEGQGVKGGYKGCLVHRVLPDGWIQSGDIVDGSGANSVSASGDNLPEESYAIDHSQPGILGMCNRGPHSNTIGSQFYITLRDLSFLDGKTVAIGRVVSGMRTVRRIAKLPCANERPTTAVVITECSVMPLKIKEDDE